MASTDRVKEVPPMKNHKAPVTGC